MKVIIENIVSNTMKVQANPVWLIVDERRERVQIKDKKDKVVKKIVDVKVRCHIAITDYESKKDALYIAEIIKKALEKSK